MRALLLSKRREVLAAVEFSHILVPLDGSMLAEKSLPYAQALAEKFDAQLILCRILPPLVATTDDDSTKSHYTKILPQLEAEANAYLNRVQDKLRNIGFRTQTELLEGEPIAEMILELACDKMIDLIVMSTHGYSGNKRWVYGSVADKVLQQAPCPVFLVRVADMDR